MARQTYATHRRFVPLYHYFLTALVLLTLIGACVNLYKSLGDEHRLYNASLILVLTICLLITALVARTFPLKAQDRAIRAEENLRHYVLTGSLLDPRIDTRQAVGLRFASDEELAELAKRAAEEGLSEEDIKKAIKNWRPDEYRV